MRRLPTLVVLCLAVSLCRTALATPSPEQAALERGPPGRVAAVIDGDTLRLEDGREVRLVGIQAPKLPLGRADFSAWPLADEAKAFLEELALGREVQLGFGGQRGDRHGRVLAHLFAEDGRWLQGALLSAGLARVYSFADNRSLVAEMLALESAARTAGRGIWTHPFYAPRDPTGVAQHLDSFELVEGRVLAVGRAKGRAYLNFGADWHSDFTVALDRKALRLFEDGGIAPEDYAGRRVRVRGWVREFNGPLIEASHPEQIELLAP